MNQDKKQKSPKTFIRTLIGVTIGLIVLVVIFGIIVGQKGAVRYEIVKTTNASHKALEKPLSSYTIEELKALPTDKRRFYDVVVPASIEQNQVKPTVEKIISDITGRDGDIDEIVVWLYSDRKLVENKDWDVATATWAPQGELGRITPNIAETNDRSSYKISIQIKANLEGYLKQRVKSETKFGLTEKQRRGIFTQIVKAEDRAQAEADQRYPSNPSDPSYQDGNIEKNIDLERKLATKYRAQVFKKYGITKAIGHKISIEGIKENWPFPPRPPSS